MKNIKIKVLSLAFISLMFQSCLNDLEVTPEGETQKSA